MDEPTANLDPESSKTVRDFILELKKEKKTIFINTHNLDEAEKVCDRIGILKTRLVAVGAYEGALESIWGRTTVIQLTKVDGSIVAAVKALGPGSVVVDGNRLIDRRGRSRRGQSPDRRGHSRAGGRVQGVTELLPSLEDVYLRLVRS